MQQQGQGQPIHPGSISSGPMHAGQQQQQQGGHHVPSASCSSRGCTSSASCSSRGCTSPGRAVHEWQPPRDDVNSPDLYIPVMAIVTYILLTGLHAGIHVPSGIRPQILGETTSCATLVVLFDFPFVKLGGLHELQPRRDEIRPLRASRSYRAIDTVRRPARRYPRPNRHSPLSARQRLAPPLVGFIDFLIM
ncbi:hypothetical protein D9611_012410 [Ephemerocybe angulata]|uniref:Protein YIF1 n=1 Tax=Ephemerocybe angulata TaxID=980116 RepID=A0A8H5FKC1_9AGAR|nr:hypothetical protein D9611_012410 [Tulosesus angulatus]